MTRTQKSPLLEATKKFKIRKRKTKSNTRESDMESESAIVTELDSTTQISVNTMSARLSVETLNLDRTLDDFNSVCVKIEIDERFNTAADFYSAYVKSEHVKVEEMHPDCNKQVHLVHEQTGCLQIEQAYSKQDGFTSECVKSEQTECEVMHQDVPRQAFVNSVCVNKTTTANPNVYTAQDDLDSVFGKAKGSLNLNTDQSYITTNDLNYVSRIAQQYINTDTGSRNTTANNHNALCDHTYSKTPDNQAELDDLNSVYMMREEMDLSNVDQYCAGLTANEETIKIDHFSKPNVPRHSNSDKDDSDKDHGNTTANNHNALCDHTFSKTPENRAKLADPNSVFLTKKEIELSNIDQHGAEPTVGGETIKMDHNSNPNVPRHSNSEKDYSAPSPQSPSGPQKRVHALYDYNARKEDELSFKEGDILILLDQTEKNANWWYVQHTDPKYNKQQMKGYVPRYYVALEIPSSPRKNAVTRKPAKMKLKEEGDRVKKVKIMKKAKTPEKDKTEYSLVSCMNLELPDNAHFLYCGECNKEFEGDCPVHGPFNFIQDKEVPEGDPLKADNTLPDCLEIKTSKIAGAGLGVFSKEGLESRIMFGPYVGAIIIYNHKSGYCWKVQDGHASHFVNAKDKATSNWMRYVNCAMTQADRNLVALQYKGGIYYCTLKPVSPGEELLVWYYDEFAREFGLIRDKNLCNYSSKNSCHLKTHMMIQTGERLFTCEVCNKAFENPFPLKTHIRLHTGVRTNKCEVCATVFENTCQMKAHMRLHTGKRVYKCEVCGKTFRQKSNLKKHMRLHTEERLYKCEVCGYACNQSGYLKVHMRIHTGERPYKCEVCGKAFNNSGKLKIHTRIHTGERPYKCEVCGYSCKHSVDLKRHKMIHTGERPYKCEVCGYSCIHSVYLKRHMMIHTGERPYKCEVCGYTCNTSSKLKTHMRIHAGERPYMCEVCGYACNRSGSLKKHMMIHTGERQYKCEVCGKAFENTCQRKAHMRLHTGERPYKCEVCGKAFEQKGNLKKHMMTHTEERLYMCEVCGYACNQRCDLKTHTRIHTGERPYKCEVCGKAFNHSGHLKKHTRIHTGERPYKCEVCGYSCKHSVDLKRHMMIHTGERQNKCEVCGKAFENTCQMKAHMRLHTGERPYKCEVCGKAFELKSNLKRHMMIHTGERPYKCEVCGYTCNRSSDLKTHMRIHTGERPYKCEVCGYSCKHSVDLKRHKMIHTGERPYKCEVCGYSCIHSVSLKRHMMIHTGERPYKCEVCGYTCNRSSDFKTHMRIHTGERPYKC